MAENIASKEVAPLIEKAELDLEAATTGPEIQVDANATSTQGRKIGDFLADRTTYYWVALIAQLGSMTTSSVIIYNGDHIDSDNIYTISAAYSFLNVIFIVQLIRSQSKKSSEIGPKRTLAGKHYAFSVVCASVNIVLILTSFILSMISTFSGGFAWSSITQVIVGLHLVGAIACVKAACITRLSAQAVRGTKMVNDPEYRVPAWHLATADESRIYRRSDRRVQLPA